MRPSARGAHTNAQEAGGPEHPARKPGSPRASSRPRGRGAGSAISAEILAVIEALADGVVIEDASGSVLAANGAARRLLGADDGPSTLSGWRLGAITAGGEPLPEARQPWLVALRSGGGCGPVSIGLPRPGGAHTWLSVTARPIVAPGDTAPYAVACTLAAADRGGDATYGEDHRLLRTVIEALPGYVMIRDAEGRILLANQAAAELFGSAITGLEGQRLAEFPVTADRVASSLAGDSDALAGGGAVFVAEERFVDARGREHWLQVQKLPIAIPGHDRGVLVVVEEMTERKKLERELEENRQLLRTVIDTDPSLIYVKDAAGRYLLVNQALAARLGLPQDEVLGRPQSDFAFGAEALRAWHAEDRKVLRTAQALRAEHRSGDETNPTWYDTHKAPITLPGGKRGVLGISHDITAHKQAEAARRKSEERYQRLLDRLPLAVYSGRLDSHEGTLAVSSGFERLFGMPAPASLAEWLAAVHPDDREQELQQPAALRAGTGPSTTEYRMVTPGGRIFWVLDDATVVSDPDGTRWVLGFVIDITARKHAEEQLQRSRGFLRSLMDAATAEIAVKDEEGRFVFVNPRGAAPYGKTPEEMVGVLQADLTPDQAAVEEYLAADRQVMLSGEAILHPELPWTAPDGSTRWYETHRVPVTLEDGRPGVLIFEHDITDRKLTEDRLRASEERFRELVEQLPLYTYRQRLDGDQAFEYKGPQLDTLLNLRDMRDDDDLVEQVHPEDRDRYLRAGDEFDGRVERGDYSQPWRLDYRVIDRDGRVRWLHDEGVVVQGTDGSPMLQGFLLDITAQHEAEAALREANERFELAAQAVAGIVYEWDVAAGTLQVSGGLSDIFGHDAGAPLSIQWWQKHVHPDDRDTVSFNLNALRAAHNGFDIEYRFRHADGRYLEVWDSGKVLRGPAGEVRRVVGTLVDVSERNEAQRRLREAETRYRTLVEQIPAYIAAMDEFGSMIYMSPSTEEIIGVRTAEWQANPRVWFERIHPDDRDEVMSAIHRAAAEGTPYNADYRILGSRREYLWVHDSGVVLNEGPGNTPVLQGVILDITDRKQMEAALSEANAQLTEHLLELQQRSREVQVLSEMSEILQACLTAEEAYEVVMDFGRQLFPDCSGTLSIISNSRSHVEPVASWGPVAAPSEPFVPDTCWALRRGRLHEVQDTRSGLLCRHLSQPPPDAYLCMSLMAKGEALGVLQVTAASGGITPEKSRVAVAVAENLALSLANLRLRESLRLQSIRDPLTGLYNRRYMEESLEREVSRVVRSKSTLSVIMLDIDHFKRFNDAFGHEAGDVLLRDLGALLQARLRAEDIACRYGGEEILLILPDASLEHAASRAEEIREAIKKMQVSYRRQALGAVTASFGIAAYPHHGSSAQSLIRTADSALYRAKRLGRDRVVTAEDTLSASA